MPANHSRDSQSLPDATETMYRRFEIFRDYAKHEDELTHNRLLWNINIQGFLLATYGYSIQKLLEQGSPLHKAAVFPLILLLPLLGVAVSFLSATGVWAATHAIENLNDQWERILRDEYPEEKTHLRLPKLIGGGVPGRSHIPTIKLSQTTENRSIPSHPKRIHAWGLAAPRWFSSAFGILWILLFFAFLGVLRYTHSFTPQP